MAWFYEICSADNTVLKRNSGFVTEDAAKAAGREDAKQMKNSHQISWQNLGPILVGQNKEAPTRN